MYRDKLHIFIRRPELEALGHLLLQVHHLVAQVLKLEVELVNPLHHASGVLPDPLRSMHKGKSYQKAAAFKVHNQLM